ncbi:MAG: MlaD family protein [Treponema sp.]|jgi:phospholipid/cholesterol/gamma-HCH transport system substrate-binding protein|nr:MlaD family protein [Treponema sp.]
MRFRIRFADQIVGILAVIALLALLAVIMLLGSRQRWFARDYLYTAYFDSAAGLSRNMTVQYKGFTIGSVKKIRLTEDDRVEAAIAIYDSYADRVREGSLVEVVISPINLGNQFLFYAGLGERLLEEGETIPNRHSPEARELIRAGLAFVPSQDDSIALLLSRANTILDNVNQTIVQVNGALAGEDSGSLGRILDNVEGAVSGVSTLAEDTDSSIRRIAEDLRPVVLNLQTLSAQLAAPDNTIAAVLNPEEPVYTSLVASLEAVSSTLRNLERTSAALPARLPQAAALLGQLQEAVQTAEDVLVALTNNPLLKNGVPAQPRIQSSGASARDMAF